MSGETSQKSASISSASSQKTLSFPCSERLVSFALSEDTPYFLGAKGLVYTVNYETERAFLRKIKLPLVAALYSYQGDVFAESPAKETIFLLPSERAIFSSAPLFSSFLGLTCGRQTISLEEGEGGKFLHLRPWGSERVEEKIPFPFPLLPRRCFQRESGAGGDRCFVLEAAIAADVAAESQEQQAQDQQITPSLYSFCPEKGALEILLGGEKWSTLLAPLFPDADKGAEASSSLRWKLDEEGELCIFSGKLGYWLGRERIKLAFSHGSVFSALSGAERYKGEFVLASQEKNLTCTMSRRKKEEYASSFWR